MSIRFCVVGAVLLAGVVRADEIVTASPNAVEVGRFQVATVADQTVKLDTRTAQAWYLCVPAKSKKQSWCRFAAKGTFTAGPVGRYQVVERTQVLMLLDSVSGRSWSRCDDPTPEKTHTWCSVDEG